MRKQKKEKMQLKLKSSKNVTKCFSYFTFSLFFILRCVTAKWDSPECYTFQKWYTFFGLLYRNGPKNSPKIAHFPKVLHF